MCSKEFYFRLIIGPKWNWNAENREKIAEDVFLIIGPKWNWNSHCSCKCESRGGTYNRTKVELKPGQTHWLLVPPAPYNRTKVELKLVVDDQDGGQWRLIIGPKWNWNVGDAEHFGVDDLLIIGPKWNWNRRSSPWCGPGAPLIIGPKWNWNTVHRAVIAGILALIIGPKWNWNIVTIWRARG